MKFFSTPLSAFVLSLVASGCTNAELSTPNEEAYSQAVSPLTGPYTLQRVRHCSAPLPVCNSQLTQQDYSFWDAQGVAELEQRNTLLAKLSEPTKAHVEHVVFVAAGQQHAYFSGNVFPSAGLSNGLTGQQTDFRTPFNNDPTLAAAQVTISPDSLVSSAVDNGLYDLNKTFIGLAFDAAFNYEISAAQKDKLEQAYYQWLVSKFEAPKLKSIYLAGHSRGGCLAFRLGKLFNQNFPGKKIIIHGFDPVCSFSDGEFGTTSTQVTNPLNSNYAAYTSDIPAAFGSPAVHTSLLNFVSGAPVLSGATSARGLSHTTGTGAITDLGWFEQRWIDAIHNNIENAGSVANSQAYADLAAELASIQPDTTPPDSASANLYLPFDTLSGSSVPDLAGGSASLVGSSANLLVSGANLQAYNLAGTRYVSIANSTNVDIGTEDFSILAWVRPSADSLQTILDKRTRSGSLYRGYHMMVWGSKLLVQLATPERNWINFYDHGPSINDCRWHLVGVTVDRDNPNGGLMHVDGNIIRTFNPTSLAGSLSNAAPLFVGKHQFGGAPFRGAIDELTIQKKVLSPAQIKDYYDALVATLPAGSCSTN